MRSDDSTRPLAASSEESSASDAITVPVSCTGPVGAFAAASVTEGTQPRTTITASESESFTGDTTQKPFRESCERSAMKTWSAAGPHVPSTVTRRLTALDGSPSSIENSDCNATGAA